MNAVYALYPDPDSAQRAVDTLRSSGVADPHIQVISSEPFEEYEFSHRDKATRMPWIAAAGGAVGLSIGTWLTWYTETAWPIRTGGMPIVAWWPNLIVMFEVTMLGGILASVGTLIVTAPLARRRPRLYDPGIMDGQILVGVSTSASVSLDVVERALASVEGARVRTL